MDVAVKFAVMEHTIGRQDELMRSLNERVAVLEHELTRYRSKHEARSSGSPEGQARTLSKVYEEN